MPLSHHPVCDDTTEHLTASLLPLEISKLLSKIYTPVRCTAHLLLAVGVVLHASPTLLSTGPEVAPVPGPASPRVHL